MPNGTTTDATINAIVTLSNHITLDNVYYIPYFNVNFISVTQLTLTSVCFFIFHNDKCMILQNLSQQRIGLAEQFGDLYVLHVQPPSSLFASSFNIVSTLDNAKIWHHRLGHISESIHKCISVQFSFIPFNKTGHCDTCHFSKHKISYIMLALLHLLKYLTLCMLTYGVLILPLPLMNINILLHLQMIIVGLHG